MGGEMTPRDPVTLLPLKTLPDGWDWLVSLDDADTFVKAQGMGWSCTGIVEHLATQSTHPSIALMEQNPQLFTSKDVSAPSSATSSEAPKSAEPPAPPIVVQSSTTIHRVETRRNDLTSVIAKAKEMALSPDDVHSHWASFVELAESPNRPRPLLGFAEEEGVKYQSERGIKFITKRNFGRRISRASTDKAR